MNRKNLLKMLALVACLMCSLGAAAAEAYACYTPENTTLTFYYDNYRSSRTGTTYDLNEGNNNPGWLTDGTCVSVTQVVFDPAFADVRPTSACNWFSDMINLVDISGLDYLNTSEVTDMSYMFDNCCKLTGGSDFLSTLDTGNVTNMAYMFFNCCNLKAVNLSNFNTQRVTNMSSVFKFCSKLTTLDISSFDTFFVQQMQYMFHGCSALTTIYSGNGWSSASITNSENMFLGCTNLVGGRGTTYDANHLDIRYAHIDFGTVNPGYFTDINAPTEPEAYAVLSPDSTTLSFYYDLDRIIRQGTSYYLNEGYDDPRWSFNASYETITRVVFDPSFADARPTTTCSWFWGMSNLQSISGMEYLNTSDVTIMWGMFTNCTSLTSIDASSFDTGKVTNALGMFNGCTNLTTIYGGDGWNTNSMSVSNYMFTDCVNLVGGMGTTYDANHTNKAYAHIDGGPSNPGYFTAKFTRGDVDGDGKVNIADVTALINYLLTQNATGVNVAAADCDQDSKVNISDVTELINYLLRNNW